MAAATFFNEGIRVDDLSQAAATLSPIAGSVAAVIFATALLFAGVSSSITAGMAAGTITAGMTEKRAIASYAAALIKPDDFVYVDAGSTTEALCDSITETYATYVTNSIAIASKLVSKGCRTIVLGGELKDLTRAMVGPDALEVLAKYHFTKGFWGTNGASPEYGFTTPDINEADIKRRSMERCDTCYVLCDMSKFNQISPVAFATFDDATVITGHLRDERLKGHENIIETMTSVEKTPTGVVRSGTIVAGLYVNAGRVSDLSALVAQTDADQLTCDRLGTSARPCPSATGRRAWRACKTHPSPRRPQRNPMPCIQTQVRCWS